jgi:hypothetical protein
VHASAQLPLLGYMHYYAMLSMPYASPGDPCCAKAHIGSES